MKRVSLLAAALAGAAILPATAQNVSTSITHPRIYNGNQPVTGKVEVRAIDSHGIAQSVVSADGTVNGQGRPFAGTVTAGVISGLSVPDQCTSSALTPNTPLYFQVVVTPTATPNSTIAWLLPPRTACGSTYALDSFRASQVAVTANTGSGTGGTGSGPALTLTTTGTGAATYNGTTGALNIPTPTAQAVTSLTTTGSGVASLAGGVLNIPTPVPYTPPTVKAPLTPTCSGTLTISFPSIGEDFVDVTPTAACTITFAGVTGGHAAGLRVRVKASSYAVTFSSTGVSWSGGTAPSAPTSTQDAVFHLSSFGSGNAAGND